MTNNSAEPYRGIYGIPAIPFNEDESLDTRSLESVLEFSVDNGCHGIVMPVMASEYQALTDTERRTVFDITTFMDGAKKDEKLNFQKGFRLPGRLQKWREPYLYSEYQVDPIKYPVESQWMIQMNTTVRERYLLFIDREGEMNR